MRSVTPFFFSVLLFALLTSLRPFFSFLPSRYIFCKYQLRRQPVKRVIMCFTPKFSWPQREVWAQNTLRVNVDPLFGGSTHSGTPKRPPKRVYCLFPQTQTPETITPNRCWMWRWETFAWNSNAFVSSVSKSLKPSFATCMQSYDYTLSFLLFFFFLSYVNMCISFLPFLLALSSFLSIYPSLSLSLYLSILFCLPQHNLHFLFFAFLFILTQFLDIVAELTLALLSVQ